MAQKTRRPSEAAWKSIVQFQSLEQLDFRLHAVVYVQHNANVRMMYIACFNIQIAIYTNLTSNSPRGLKIDCISVDRLLCYYVGSL